MPQTTLGKCGGIVKVVQLPGVRRLRLAAPPVDEASHRCEDCRKGFGSAAGLASHRRHAHGASAANACSSFEEFDVLSLLTRPDVHSVEKK